MKVYSFCNQNEIIGFRMNDSDEWHDISNQTAKQYQIYEKLLQLVSKKIIVKEKNGMFYSEFEEDCVHFLDQIEDEMISSIEIACSAMSSYYLMLKDKPILYFNFEEFIIEVLEPDFLPFSLRGSLYPQTDMKSILRNVSKIKEYFSSRVLSLYRKNAKEILNLLKLSQRSDIETRCNIALYCKGLSLTDAYWVKKESSEDQWRCVNLFENHLDDALIEVALNGVSYTPTTNPVSPELTTKGLFQKAWVRKKDGLYLYKSDSLDDKTNTKAEVIASQILDCINVRHCEYWLEEFEGLTVAVCKCIADDKVSMVDAVDVQIYCDNIGMSFKRLCEQIGGTDYSNMFVVDYIISNTDRHNENWGFYMDNETGKLISMIPLYDHNLSLVADVTGASKEDLLSNFKEYTTLKEGAFYQIKKSNIKMIKDLDTVDYMGYYQIQESVKKRIQELGILK